MRRPDAADRLATGLGLAAVARRSAGRRWPLSDWRWVMAGMALGLGVVTLVLSTADRARGGGEPDRTRAAATGPTRGTPAAALEIFRHALEGLAAIPPAGRWRRTIGWCSPCATTAGAT